jgi:hypothetical protein
MRRLFSTSRENLDVADLDKLVSKNLTRLYEYGDVILTFTFLRLVCYVKPCLFTVIPRYEFTYLVLTNLFAPKYDIRGKGPA